MDALLQDLEREVMVPIVPGELLAWCASVARRCPPVADVLDGGARPQLEQIISEDLALAARVQNLREKGTSLNAEFGDLVLRLQGLQQDSRHESGAPKSSREPSKEAEALREDFASWIVRRRLFESEIQAWLVESLLRDRGTKD